MSFIKKIVEIKTGIKLLFSLLAVLVAVLCGSAHAEAASLGISPSGGTVSVGNTITVRVVVNSNGQSINAVSGAITFSNDTLSLTGISKSGSIVTLWAEDPTYSNSSGSASFQGVILNGYTGSSGRLVTLTFKAKAAGTGTISILSGGSSVLLNDGQGTNALSNTSGASFNIGTVIKKVPPVITQVIPPPEVVQPVVPVVVPTVPQTPEVPVVVPIAPQVPVVPIVAPVFTDYQNPLSPGTYIVVKGTATPNTVVAITFTNTSSNGDTLVTQTSLPVSATGIFTYVSDEKVLEGSSYTLVATGQDGQHTDTLSLVAKNSLSFLILAWFATFFALKVSVLFFAILLIAYLYLLYRNHVLKKQLATVIGSMHEVQVPLK